MSDFRLQVFVQVAKRLNLTQAAQELNISQPAVSKHIQELETKYNTNLLDRSRGKIALTPSGRMFLTHAEKILNQYGALEAEMYRISKKYTDEIRVSADSQIADNSLFTLFMSFCNKYPNVKVKFIDTCKQTLQQTLQCKDVDLAFINGPYFETDLLYTPCSHQKWVFVTYKDNILADKAKVSIDEIIDYGLNINIFKSCNMLDYNVLLKDNPFVSYYSDLNGLKYLTYQNDSVSLLPYFAVEHKIKLGELKVLNVDELDFHEEVGILTRPDECSSSVRSFLDFAKGYNF